MAHCGSAALRVGQASVNLLPFSQPLALAVLSRRYSMTSVAYGSGGLCSRSAPAKGLAGRERILVLACSVTVAVFRVASARPNRAACFEWSGLGCEFPGRLHQDFLSATNRLGWPDINFYNFQHMVPCLDLSQWCASKRLSHQVSLRPSSRKLKRAGAGRPPSTRSSNCSGAHLPERL
jgi:hypothetical protein